MKLLSVVLLTSSFLAFNVNAKTDFALGVDTSYVYSENKSNSLGTRSSNTLTVNPSLNISHNSRKTNSTANIRHSFLKQFDSDNDIGNNRSNFTNFNLSTRINAIDNVLQLNGRASQSYRNTNAANSLVNDELFGNRELARTENYLVGFDLTLNRFDYIEIRADGKVANVKSNRQTSLNEGLNSTNKDYNVTLFAGKEFRYVDWNLTTRYSDTNGSSRNDSATESYAGNFYIGVLKHLRIVVTGALEKNEFSNAGNNVDTDTPPENEFKTAGVGLSWFRDRSRFFDVTYNISSRSRDDGERKKFIATNFGWRFSSRTSVTGSFGRRFFGRSADFSLNHNIRKFRTRISYNEAVTNFSRLISSNQTIGGIVCPIGVSDDITQCFVPDSLDYQLQPGEEFTSLSFIVPEISEQTILRKNFIFNTNYRFRKLNLAFTANVADTDYLDGSREETRQNVTLGANMNLSKKLSVSWNNRFTKFENLDVVTDVVNNDDIWTSTLSSNYKNNRNLSTSISLRYSQRDSTIVERNYDGIRASLSMSYRF